jgi:hypothetical protein
MAKSLILRPCYGYAKSLGVADYLSPIVGTVLEIHPRASLLFGLREEANTPVREYKKSNEARKAHIQTLWQL